MNAWPTHYPWLALVEAASKRSELLQIVYCSPEKGETTRLVECYHVSSTGDHYYLHAWQVSPVTSEPVGWRTFRFDRVVSALPTSNCYKPRDDASIPLKWVNDYFDMREEIELLADEDDDEHDSDQDMLDDSQRVYS